MVQITLPHNFTARDYQLPILKALDSGYKRVVWCAHRRSGKDCTIFNWVIKKLAVEVCTCYYILPTYAQAKKVIWDSINNQGQRFLDYIPHQLIETKHQQEMKIKFINGSVLQLIGSDNIDALMGTNPKIVVFSEYAMQRPEAWDFIRPILKLNGGTAIFISTPRGKNHFYDLTLIAKDNPDTWFYERLTINDTHLLDKKDMDLERKEGMSDELIEQEYYCFPPGQYVMTHRGMVDISLVDPGDLVFTHTGRWRKVLERYERHYEGELVKIKSYGSSEDILCTDNHPIRIYERHSQKYRWTQAQYIKDKDRLCFPKMEFSPQNFITNALSRLIAWYITEGSSFKNGLQFSLRDQVEAEYVISVLNSSGFRGLISKVETGYVVICNECSLIDFLKSNCGTCASDKKIPLHLIAGWEKEFLHELIKGDGCESEYEGSFQYIYTTVSKTLAYQVQIIANSIGYTAGISKREAGSYEIEGRSGLTRESYVVRIGSVKIREESTKLIRSKYNIAACVNSVGKVHYVGKVYNLRVQYDESYTVNGRSVHNCSFDRGVEGSYYGKLIDLARREGRVGKVAYEPRGVVNTAWDIGFGDSTSIVMWQQVGQELRVIDYYENHGEGIAHYIKWLMDRPYVWGTHFFPHDAGSGSLQTGKTLQQVAMELGLKTTVLKRDDFDVGVEAVRAMLPLCWFDERNCEHLIKCLEQYHKRFSDTKKVYSSSPEHDWSSHGADCVRYMAMARNYHGTGVQSLSAEKIRDMRMRNKGY